MPKRTRDDPPNEEEKRFLAELAKMNEAESWKMGPDDFTDALERHREMMEEFDQQEPMVHPDGRTDFFEDNGDIECTEWPNGKVTHYFRSPDDAEDDHDVNTGEPFFGFPSMCDGTRYLGRVDCPDGRTDYFRVISKDFNADADNEYAPWNVRKDCISRERLRMRWFPNRDIHYMCPHNDERIVRIVRRTGPMSSCCLPRRQVLWYRVREWFRKRAIVLHWQEQTQMRLYGPSGRGRLADRAAYVSDFVN